MNQTRAPRGAVLSVVGRAVRCGPGVDRKSLLSNEARLQCRLKPDSVVFRWNFGSCGCGEAFIIQVAWLLAFGAYATVTN